MKKNISFIKRLIIFILIILFLPLVSAFEIYTEPKQIDFNNILVDHAAEKKIQVLTDAPENVDVSLSFSGIFEQWITVEPATLKINSQTPGKFILRINPQEAQLGNYQGIIVVNAVYTGNQLTSAITSAANIDLKVAVIDTEIIQAHVNNIIVNDVEADQPILVDLYFVNDGNKEITPVFQLDLYDEQKNFLDSIIQDMTILPSTDENKISFTFDNNFFVGNYQIISKIVLDNYLIGQQTAPFKIVALGTLPQEAEPLIQTQEVIPLSSTPFLVVGVLIFAIFVYYGIKKKREFDRQKKKRKKR